MLQLIHIFQKHEIRHRKWLYWLQQNHNLQGMRQLILHRQNSPFSPFDFFDANTTIESIEIFFSSWNSACRRYFHRQPFQWCTFYVAEFVGGCDISFVGYTRHEFEKLRDYSMVEKVALKYKITFHCKSRSCNTDKVKEAPLPIPTPRVLHNDRLFSWRLLSTKYLSVTAGNTRTWRQTKDRNTALRLWCTLHWIVF